MRIRHMFMCVLLLTGGTTFVMLSRNITMPYTFHVEEWKSMAMDFASMVGLYSSQPTTEDLEDAAVASLSPSGGMVEVRKRGPYMVRVKAYNRLLGRVMQLARAVRGNDTWQPPNSNARLVYSHYDHTLLHMLTNTSEQIYSVMLPWDYDYIDDSGNSTHFSSLTDMSNLLVNKYYRWIGTDPACSWVDQRKDVFQYKKVYGRTCSTNVNDSLQPMALPAVIVNSRSIPNKNKNNYPGWYYNAYPKFVHFAHILRDGIVTSVGDVFTGGIKYVPYGCNSNMRTKSPGGKSKAYKQYNEVFVISQYWAGGHYHKMMEDFPRISPYLEFLRRNPQIKVHSQVTGGYTAAFLNFVGITSDRLIGGNVNANHVIVPHGTPCGQNQVPNTQLLAYTIQEKLRSKYPQDKRNLLLLIRRSGGRRIPQHDKVVSLLRKASQEFGLEFLDYNDRHLPSAENQFRLFNRAVMVVGPHGAGLANTIFAPPGTFVIEAACNIPHMNLCFMRLAVSMGHHYHTVPARGGCTGNINVAATELDRVTRQYLPHAAKLVNQPGDWSG